MKPLWQGGGDGGSCDCNTSLVICILAYQRQENKEKVETHKPVGLKQADESLMEFTADALLRLPESAP